VRKAPNGVILPGLHRTSSWSHSYRVERHRHFFSEIVKIIDRLEPHKDLLNEIAGSGGSLCLIADLPGDVNIGSEFPWRDMARLADLHIDLGVEVYPEYIIDQVPKRPAIRCRGMRCRDFPRYGSTLAPDSRLMFR
jgi:hypothetical protein